MSKHDDNCGCEKKHDDKECKKENQFHDHEFLGSVRLAEVGSEDVHNHRFAGVSGPAIPVQGGHVHKVKSRTDFFDHFHEFEATTGLPIPVGNDGKHVHFVEAKTNVVDGHFHELIFATLINAPIFEEEA
ncbi:YmaF family protein (plasmid) [Clostridium estertheticum]|uniref:YmaF family protein n=1 Tax=Clostridium estertheticum TaxID=238834 RepID=A0AA47I810_9CLOT|nr:YmaF family protein [Clostridium estertheticum]MBU3158097.1 YmaF family protein [Clostridium estertheticum]MBU3201785.1 YmaF family protein [Clostridium estertheticum]WAG63262.1 YmaF family protein [Clostridium estertheticum]WAG68180.1 YmaF family protein [Clostridium estertheticum]